MKELLEMFLLKIKATFVLFVVVVLIAIVLVGAAPFDDVDDDRVLEKKAVQDFYSSGQVSSLLDNVEDFKPLSDLAHKFNQKYFS